MKKPHILILGAGFGGMYVARELLPYVKKGAIDVTIVNKTNYFLFTPLLHEVATGSLSPANAGESLREIFVGTDVGIIQGEASLIDTEKKTVVIGERTLSYDLLVIATGATTEYYGIPGAREYTYPLKDLADALKIKERVIDCFEEEARKGVCDHSMLSFVIVGGGPTGVETAAELSEFIYGIVKRYHKNDISCIREEARLTLVDGGAELLPRFEPILRRVAEAKLRKKGITLHLGKNVASVDGKSITLSDGTVIDTATVIWTAGVTPSIPPFVSPVALEKGRLVLDEHFHLASHNDIFALGDIASYRGAGEEKPLPLLAQAAVQEARVVARNIIRQVKGKQLQGLTYRSRGTLVSLGQWYGAGEIFSLHIYGRFAWWLWRTVYLFKFISWKKRVRIVIEWTLNIFYPRDITKPL